MMKQERKEMMMINGGIIKIRKRRKEGGTNSEVNVR
jgi:hypothetical protein